jgi:hypothetical protein
MFFDEMVESSVATGLEPLLLGPGVLGLLGLEFSFFNGTKFVTCRFHPVVTAV